MHSAASTRDMALDTVQYRSDFMETTVRIDPKSKPLGQGAYGVVYRATIRGQDAALKVVGGDDDDAVITIRELVAMLTCDAHPHVSSLLGVGPIDSSQIRQWSMPFVPRVFMWMRPAAQSLDRLIQAVRTRAKQRRDVHPWTLTESLKVIAQVASALEHMHQRGFAHRDVKSSNVLVYESHVELGDLGLARYSRRFVEGAGTKGTDGDDDRLTTNVVTRWYRAPELCVRGVTYGHEVDVWALGCIMYEVLAANEPSSPLVLFRGTAIGGNSCRATTHLPAHEAASRHLSQLSVIADRGALLGPQTHHCPVLSSACALANRNAVSRSPTVLLPLSEQLQSLLPQCEASDDPVVAHATALLTQMLHPCAGQRVSAGRVRECLGMAPPVLRGGARPVYSVRDIAPEIDTEPNCINWYNVAATINTIIAGHGTEPDRVHGRDEDTNSERKNKRRAVDGPSDHD